MKAFLLIVTLCASLTTFAQFNQKQKAPKGSNSAAGLPASERIFFGGGGGFNTGVYPNGYRYTAISINPLVGYRITLPWSAGIQLMYSSYRFPQLGYSLNQYGISPFTQYRFGKVFLHAEYQAISAPNVADNMRKIYSRLPLGIGLTQPIGTRAAINAVVMYDVLYNRRTTVFASPWVVRVYITAGGISF